MLLATPSAAVATSAAGNARKPGLLAAGRVFADNRVITSKHLGWLAAVAVTALIVVARRRILFQ
jgi:hypothetical protein